MDDVVDDRVVTCILPSVKRWALVDDNERLCADLVEAIALTDDGDMIVESLPDARWSKADVGGLSTALDVVGALRIRTINTLEREWTKENEVVPAMNVGQAAAFVVLGTWYTGEVVSVIRDRALYEVSTPTLKFHYVLPYECVVPVNERTTALVRRNDDSR
jgi:hypothetical protein